MNKTEIKEFIKSRISELLAKKINEANAIVTTKTGSKSVSYKNPSELNTLKSDPNVTSIESTAGQKIKEAILNEMARKATIFDVAPDFREKVADLKTGGPISPVKLKNILDFLEGKETVTGPEIAAGVGYEGKMPAIYPIFAALIDRGALVSTPAEEKVEIPDTPENEDVEDILQIDDEPSDELSDEPEIKSIEKVDVSMDPITKAATMFTVDNADLISSIINNFKDSRSRINMREADDLDAKQFIKAMQKSKETSAERLNTKIDQLVKKIAEFDKETQTKILSILDFKFKSVDASSLTKTIAKQLNQEIPTSTPEPQIDFDDFDDFDDDEITEDVEDIDYDDAGFKAYDSVYERMNKLVNYKG
jgi:hypothetical protein